MKRTKQQFSHSFHKVEPSRWPNDACEVYKDDQVEVVQASRSMKFFYRFYVRYRPFVFWTLQTDLSYLSRIKNIRLEYVEKCRDMLASLALPADVLPLEGINN